MEKAVRTAFSSFLKFCRNLGKQIADRQMLRTDALAFAAFQTLGCLSVVYGQDAVVVEIAVPVAEGLLRIECGEHILH